MEQDAKDELSGRDYRELMNLYSQSTRLISERDPAGWARLFTPEGTFHLPAMEHFGTEAIDIRGREALQGFISDSMSGDRNEQMGLTPDARKRYLVTNIVLDGGPPTADGRATANGSAYLFMVGINPGELPKIVASGRYEDRFVKTAEGWRIEHRSLTPDF